MLRRLLAGIVSLAALVGGGFAATSTADFVAHLDRQVHGIHCSFIPGWSAPDLSGSSGCHVTLMSPYSSFWREWLWGGIPISLLAFAVFAYLSVVPLALLVLGREGDRRGAFFLLAATTLPVLASVAMGFIAWTELEAACRLCIGIYLASLAAWTAAIGLVFLSDSDEPPMTVSHDVLRDRLGVPRIRVRGSHPDHVDSTVKEDPSATSLGVADTLEAPPDTIGNRQLAISSAMEAEFAGRDKGASRRDSLGGERFEEPLGWPVLIGAFVVGVFFVGSSVAVYALNAPDFAHYVGSCGTLESGELDVAIDLGPQNRSHQVIEILDPLCPACSGLETRFGQSSFADQVSRKGVLFPIDDACNWMVPEALHPGACIVSEAVLCARGDGDEVLRWAFENQSRIRQAVESNGGDTTVVAEMIRARFTTVANCLGSAEVRAKLNRSLRWAVTNRIPVLTPQLYVDGTRVCDADTDLGLDWTMSRLLRRVPHARRETE